jgi:hypothetical protein
LDLYCRTLTFLNWVWVARKGDKGWETDVEGWEGNTGERRKRNEKDKEWEGKVEGLLYENIIAH